MEPAGARLKKIRQERGLTLEEVQKKTKIHLNILKAIEGDSLSNLSPVYLRAFLKTYCKFLGVDPKDYVSNYKELPKEPLRIIPQESGSVRKGRNLHSFGTVTEKLGLFKNIIKKHKKILLFILVIILCVFGLYNLGKFISSRRSRRAMDEKVHSSVTEKKETKKEKKSKRIASVSEAKPVVQKTATPGEAQQSTAVVKKEVASTIRLSIKASENCWVDLKIDGRTVFRKVLEKGRFENWEAKKRIDLSLGNGGAVELEVNGQRFAKLGRRGQALKDIVITKEGLTVGR